MDDPVCLLASCDLRIHSISFGSRHKFLLQSMARFLSKAFQRWEQEIDNELKQLDQAIKQQIPNNEANSNLSITSRGVSSTYPPRLPNPVPDVRPLQLNPVGSARNLFLFQFFSYTIAIFLLAGAGFRQLYVTQPTFGANLWTDYFALLAWGFGAEATRDAVTKTIREWKLPGLK